MSLSKQRISSPLEAGQSILDVHSLPPSLTEALDYASKKLERKALHVTLLVVRKTYQLPSSVPPTPTSPVPSPALASPSWLASPVKTGLRSLVRRGIAGGPSALPLTSDGSKPMPSPALRSAASFDAGPHSPRRLWPPTPGSPPVAMTPHTPMTPGTPSSIFTAMTPSLQSPLSTPPLSSTSSSFFSSKSRHRSTNSSNTTTTGTTSKTSDRHNSSSGDLSGIRLVYTEPLSIRAEKLLRSTLHKAASKFGFLPPSSPPQSVAAWYNPTAPPALGLHAGDLVRQSLLQNEVLYSNEALSILALDRLYTFKAALSTYSRAVSAPRTRPTTTPVTRVLEDAVDELRRLILARALRPVGRSELLRSYDFVGAVGTRALAEVETMYLRAYGGEPLVPFSGNNSTQTVDGQNTVEEKRKEGDGEDDIVYENGEAKEVMIPSGPAMNRARSFMITAQNRSKVPLPSRRATRSDNNLRRAAASPQPKRGDDALVELAERSQDEDEDEATQQGPKPRSISRSSARTNETKFVKIGTPPPPKSTTPVVLPKLDTTVAAAGGYKMAAHTNGPQVIRPKPTKACLTTTPSAVPVGVAAATAGCYPSASTGSLTQVPRILSQVLISPQTYPLATTKTTPIKTTIITTPRPMGDIPIHIEEAETDEEKRRETLGNKGDDNYHTSKPADVDVDEKNSHINKLPVSSSSSSSSSSKSIGWPTIAVTQPPPPPPPPSQGGIVVGHSFSIDEMMLHDNNNENNYTIRREQGDDAAAAADDESYTPVAGRHHSSSRSSRWNSIRFSHSNNNNSRASHLGPTTPNGYDDISPITRGEWGFLFAGDTWTKTRTAAVETC